MEKVIRDGKVAVLYSPDLVLVGIHGMKIKGCYSTLNWLKW